MGKFTSWFKYGKYLNVALQYKYMFSWAEEDGSFNTGRSRSLDNGLVGAIIFF